MKYSKYYEENPAEFEPDLAEEYGLTNHPKRDAAFGFACQHGHPSGHSEIEYWYGEIAEFLTD